jgi:hypothetical protein
MVEAAGSSEARVTALQEFSRADAVLAILWKLALIASRAAYGQQTSALWLTGGNR